MIMGFGVQTASAQVKRGTAAKKPATAAKKPAAQKVNNNFAVLEFDDWINDNDPFEDEESIYFLDYPSGSSNALRAVNKQTGEVKRVSPCSMALMSTLQRSLSPKASNTKAFSIMAIVATTSSALPMAAIYYFTETLLLYMTCRQKK